MLTRIPLLDKVKNLKYGKHLEIVSISADKEINDLKSFLRTPATHGHSCTTAIK